MTIKRGKDIVIPMSRAKQEELEAQDSKRGDRKLKDQLRERLARDMAKFASSGGKVTPLPPPMDDVGSFRNGGLSSARSRR